MGLRSFFSSKKSVKQNVAAPRLSNQVTFNCTAPDAKEVRLAGTFNNWNTGATKLAQGSDGKWSVALELTPGNHEYRYIVDGQWHTDEHSERKVKNPFGSYNSAVEVRKEQ